ncbi:sporulation integral membrane protein YtvI [Mobilisporobacter senegalensis]|uniref:Sporulation integral membrane protein YtvI n=1 Tax=Mobilisporobacter senegalensis TaxID=1329262 RepID=A0A3N1XPK6_9FIRM|nr:sporulation integral membrane protein YtvI [Mobilisporobacter senegalensis]ROR28585.1 sporulation integral membrane protein YtvI [Mobilisporobacter senegalensis]
MRERKLYIKAILNLFIALITFLIIIYAVPKLLGFFMPFAIGWIIAIIANPMVKWLEKNVRIVRKHSSAIIVIGAIVIIILVLYYVITILVRECVNLIQDLPIIYVEFDRQLQSAAKSLDGLYKMLPESLQGTVNSWNQNLGVYISDIVKSIKIPSISTAGSIARNVAEIFFMTIITILSAYFFIAERENLTAYMKKHTPRSVQEKYTFVMNNFKLAVGGYLKAQLKITLIMMVIVFIGLEILRVDYSFFIAFIVAFIDLLPIFGTGAVFWPWALFDALSGNYVRAIGIMVIYLICQVIRQVLQPKMVGDSIGISPFMTLVFMYIGYKFQGILGLILGLPIGMIIVNFYHAGAFDGIINTIKMIIDDINNFRRMDK